MEYEFEKYSVSVDKVGWLNIGKAVREKLNTFGVAVVPSLLNENECNSMESKMLDFLETISSSWETPINRHDSKTFKEIYRLFLKHSMLIQNFKVGHSQAVWDVRQNLKFLNVYSKFLN